ncbi:MAG: histidine phosphatase family protein [Oscillospiraceae bacterium]
MRTYKIHLIRHGFTKANLDGAYCGSTDLPLCPEGEQNLYDILAEYSYPYVEAVYTSPMLRARQTSDILFPDCEYISVEGLRESSFGRFEGKTLKELKLDDEFNRWVTPGSSFCPKGVDDPQEFFKRCCGAFLWIVDDMMSNDTHDAAIVTHAGVIGNILAQFAYPKKAPYDWQCSPGCGFVAVADPSLYLREPVIEVINTIPEYEEPSDKEKYPFD